MQKKRTRKRKIKSWILHPDNEVLHLFQDTGLGCTKAYFFRRSYDSQWKTVSSFAKETKGFTVSNWNNSTMYGIPNLQQKTCPPFMHADRTGEEHPIYSQKWFVQQSRKSQEICRVSKYLINKSSQVKLWGFFFLKLERIKMRGNVKSLVHIIVDNIRQETFTEMANIWRIKWC